MTDLWTAIRLLQATLNWTELRLEKLLPGECLDYEGRFDEARGRIDEVGVCVEELVDEIEDKIRAAQAAEHARRADVAAAKGTRRRS